MRTVTIAPDFDSWRAAARQLLQQNCPPESVLWQMQDSAPLLFGGSPDACVAPAESETQADSSSSTPPAAFPVPQEFIHLARDICRHRDPERSALLYRVLYRLTHGERNLLNIQVDDDVHRMMILDRQVGTDRHRMLGFLRFERLEDEQGEFYFAWYRPDHLVLPTVAPEFVRRLKEMRWSILTPDQCAHWDGRRLTYSPGTQHRPGTTDQIVGLWKIYYAATYIPQRRNPMAFRRFVPTRFLKNLPEGQADMPR